MTIFTDTFIPYEFENKREALDYIINRAINIKRSLRFVEMDTEHLIVRCPVSADYLEIVGTQEELNWLHIQLTKGNWYRVT